MAGTPWRPPSLVAEGSSSLGVSLPSGEVIQEAPFEWSPCHRIIASEYAGESLFDRIDAANEADALREIADLTNPHVQQELGHIELVRPEDRIYGHGAGLIMAAFAYPARPSRFSDGLQGTYYATRAEQTAIFETVYHDELTLRGTGPAVLEKTLVHADLIATLVDIRTGRPSPARVYDPVDYGEAQAFGRTVRHLDGYGIGYDSVRHEGGECAAIFRPAVLSHATPVRTLLYDWDGDTIVVR
jgi:hypothetical protein